MMFKGITPSHIIEYYNVQTEEEIIYTDEKWIVHFSSMKTLGFPIALEFKTDEGAILHSEYRWNGQEYVLDDDADQFIPGFMKRIHPSFKLGCEAQRDA